MNKWIDRLPLTRTRRSIWGTCLVLAIALSGCGVQAPVSSHADDTYWELADPNDFGWGEAEHTLIEEAIAQYREKINSVILIRNGKLIYEQYFHHTEPDAAYPVYSVSKSILSALTGIAIREGYLSGTDERIADLMPERFTDRDSSSLSQLTVEHLLTMSGGLRSVDPIINSWYRSNSWINFVLDQPALADAGLRFDYNTGLTHLLSAVLTEASGMSTKELADKYLFGPMAITNYEWEKDPEGYYIGGTKLSMTARDMAKFGYLYLHHGNWEGEQLIPKEWIEQSLASSHTASDYGYLFWLEELTVSSGQMLQTFEANGYGGQHVRIVPALDAVIVVTSNPNISPANADDLIDEYMVPALANQLPEVLEPVHRLASLPQ